MAEWLRKISGLALINFGHTNDALVLRMTRIYISEFPQMSRGFEEHYV
jgi:hypothetical protein